jgi:hypothetical protein
MPRAPWLRAKRLARQVDVRAQQHRLVVGRHRLEVREQDQLLLPLADA